MKTKFTLLVMLALGLGCIVTSAQLNDPFYEKHINLSLEELMNLPINNDTIKSEQTINSEDFYTRYIDLSLEELMALTDTTIIDNTIELTCESKAFYQKHIDLSLEQLMDIQMH